MSRHPDFVPQGVIPAVLLPFHDDLSIDEANFRAHLRDVAAVQGLSAITVNAHSTEVASCTRTNSAVSWRSQARKSAANCRSFTASGRTAAWRRRGSHGRPRPAAHRRCWCSRRDRSRWASRPRWRWRISRPSPMPAICRSSCFNIRSLQARAIRRRRWSGCSTKCRPSARSRTGRQTVPHHESQIRALQGRARPINVLSTNSAWLLSSLVLGCNGLLSGSGSVIADLQARLFRAVKANDLAEARRLNDRIYPTARVFYADPFVDMHNRMKEALVLLGKLPRAVVRPPLVKISDAEIARIRDALIEAGLLDARTAQGRNAA